MVGIELNVMVEVPALVTVYERIGNIKPLSCDDGVNEELFDEYDPVPIIFVADTLNIYAVFNVKPVTVADVVVDVPSLNVVQEEPESEEY